MCTCRASPPSIAFRAVFGPFPLFFVFVWGELKNLFPLPPPPPTLSLSYDEPSLFVKLRFSPQSIPWLHYAVSHGNTQHAPLQTRFCLSSRAFIEMNDSVLSEEGCRNSRVVRLLEKKSLSRQIVFDEKIKQDEAGRRGDNARTNSHSFTPSTHAHTNRNASLVSVAVGLRPQPLRAWGAGSFRCHHGSHTSVARHPR